MTVPTHRIEAFEQMRSELESTQRNQWVLVHHGRLVGAYPDFESAAASAEERFDGGPCLIGQVGALPIPLPGGAVSPLLAGLSNPPGVCLH